MANILTIQNGQTITDAVLISTGNIVNWDAFLTANNILTWVPLFNGGEVLQVPSNAVTDANNMRGLAANPPANNAYGVYPLIDTLFALFP